MAILDRLVQNAYRIQRRTDPMHKRSVTVCGTSRIRTLIQTRAPRRRFFTRGSGASLGFVPDWNTDSERRWRGETNARLG